MFCKRKGAPQADVKGLWSCYIVTVHEGQVLERQTECLIGNDRYLQSLRLSFGFSMSILRGGAVYSLMVHSSKLARAPCSQEAAMPRDAACPSKYVAVIC